MSRLPTETIEGREYFRDDRLREFSAVDNPADRIGFDAIAGHSRSGRRIRSLTDLRGELARLLDYNWGDEANDYGNCSDDDPGANDRVGHIFETLVALDNWVNRTTIVPESYVTASRDAARSTHRAG